MCNERQAYFGFMVKMTKFEMNHRRGRLDRDKGNTHTFVSKEYHNLMTYRDAIGLKMTNSTTVPVCYGGVFAIKEEQILHQTETSWQNLENALTREDNLVEGHFTERMWAAILSGLDNEYARQVDKVVVPNINETSGCIGRAGMILISKDVEL